MGSTGKTSGGNIGFFGGGGGLGIAPTSQQTPPINPAPTATIPPVNADNPQVESQAPNDQNTPVTQSALDKISKMSDDELAALVIASKNAKMPNFLADRPDATQRFVFQAGLNELPMVLDQSDFNQYLQDNGISQGEILARSVNGANYTNQQGYSVKYTPQQVLDIMRYSRLNYIGGKHGGQAYGAGAYFAMTGGGSTGYGGTTAQAVLNPKTARIIDDYTLYTEAQTFARTHPKFAQAMGGTPRNASINQSNQSIWALAMGYNVITDHSPDSSGNYVRRRGGRGDYYNIIDRSALVYKK